MRSMLVRGGLAGVLILVLVSGPAVAQNASRTRLWSTRNPSNAGATVTLRAEVDGLGGGSPTGWAGFWDGATRLGYAQLFAAGAGQTTLQAHLETTCALTVAGGVKCWGENRSGQIGDGTRVTRTTPVDVSGLTSGVVAIAAGGSHNCAITAAGGAKCWGVRDKLGDGSGINQLTPVDVVGLTSGVVALAASRTHTCALTTAGGVKCWGENYSGELGDGTRTHRLIPVDVVGLTSGVVALAVGEGHSCAVTAAGGVKCWGYNYYGQLGDGSRDERHVPVDVSGLAEPNGAVAIVAGYGHTCVVIAGGGVKCWGRNDYGQLGDNTWRNRLTPVDVVGLTRGAAAIAAGYGHTCALTTAGGVRCWGWNLTGQLGNGTTTKRYAPANVSGLTSGAVAVTAGWTHACALTAAGAVKCWGSNLWGELGDGTFAARLTPVTVGFAGLVRSRASFVTEPLSAGSHPLAAGYAGDATHTGSHGALLQTVK